MKRKALILLGSVICLSFAACGGTSEKGTDSESNAVVQESSENLSDIVEVETEEIEEKVEETESQDVTVCNMNESAQLKDWEITVTEMQILDSIEGDYGTFSPDSEDGKFAKIAVSVTNNGKQANSFLPSYGYGDDVHVKLLYGDGFEFVATNLLGYDNDMHDAHINPLSTQTGEIAFEIPDSVASSEDEILISFISGNDAVQFKVR